MSQKLSILDLGCGKFFPDTLLFSAQGHHVTAVDASYVVSRVNIVDYFRSLRLNGVTETARYFQLDLSGERRKYLRHLKGLSKLNLRNGGTFICNNIECMTSVADSSYNLVCSKDVFEHVGHVDLAVKEIHRVLKPHGISIHLIHLFSSFTGGHNPECYNFKKWPPWDHLRKENFTLPSFLNRKREEAFLKAFANTFPVTYYEDLSPPIDVSGLLSEDIFSEIRKRYPSIEKSELLKEKILVISKKT